jgi:hypothetical protein
VLFNQGIQGASAIILLFFSWPAFNISKTPKQQHTVLSTLIKISAYFIGQHPEKRGLGWYGYKQLR